MGFDFKYVPSLGTREKAIVRLLPPALPLKSHILTFHSLRPYPGSWDNFLDITERIK